VVALAAAFFAILRAAGPVVDALPPLPGPIPGRDGTTEATNAASPAPGEDADGVGERTRAALPRRFRVARRRKRPGSRRRHGRRGGIR
jgi:hypothetical protein